jgi:hypothetical protein
MRAVAAACRSAGFLSSGEVVIVADLTEEEKKRILESAPKGTWALLLGFGLISTLAWLYFFFGLFLSHGPVR